MTYGLASPQGENVVAVVLHDAAKAPGAENASTPSAVASPAVVRLMRFMGIVPWLDRGSSQPHPDPPWGATHAPDGEFLRRLGKRRRVVAGGVSEHADQRVDHGGVEVRPGAAVQLGHGLIGGPRG